FLSSCRLIPRSLPRAGGVLLATQQSPGARKLCPRVLLTSMPRKFERRIALDNSPRGNTETARTAAIITKCYTDFNENASIGHNLLNKRRNPAPATPPAGLQTLPGAGSKCFSNLSGTPFQASASAGGSPLRVMLGQASAYCRLISTHFSMPASVSG